MAFLRVLGRVMLFFGRGIFNMFFYNKPRRFGFDAVRRVGLFLFYATALVGFVMFILVAIALFF
jgi:hypothetical protein